MNLEIDPPPFVAFALCAQTDPEIFFPEQGTSSRTARSVCRLCCVRRECLLFAMETGEQHGVWGGLTPMARRRVRRRMRYAREHGLAS